MAEHVYRIVVTTPDDTDLIDYTLPVSNALDVAVEAINEELWEAFTADTQVRIEVNGHVVYETEPVCPRCHEPYDPSVDWSTDGSDACSSCYHNARRGGWNGDRLPLDTDQDEE